MKMLGQHPCWCDIFLALSMIIRAEKLHFTLAYCISKPKKWYRFKDQQPKQIVTIFMKIVPLLDRVTNALRNIGPDGHLFLSALQNMQVNDMICGAEYCIKNLCAIII